MIIDFHAHLERDPESKTYASINVFNVLELPKATQRKLFYENAKRLLKL